ncbi:translation elongation factor P (EF-P) [Candidatus Phytoplasma mali]|uniref:Elongation factor P n=1 Tax=Phytoplasma mali (strain AT) TaxID=482235 RepID=EFP_PHYMT|nr:elongation factor P [Candidatus Phytoplasma mali]B3R0E7.1 RecName: Full=Elongation factor P; Short=EF-P [Candidatus Phytoplasma mali AT]CAP18311.1 translation elongation factor P (EF-P) [Candidatus Phytoplasma mali]
MISTNDFKTGQTIKFNNNLFQIVSFLHVKPGKGAAFVRCKLKNLRTGSIIDNTFNSGIKVELAFINKNKIQFLYIDGNKYIFINIANYEQIEIEKQKIKNKIKYLYEGIIVDVVIYNDYEILDINLPEKLNLTVTKTEFIEKKDVKTNYYKDATLETGLVIKVPLFIQQGEKIIVNTQTGLYVSRCNK